MKTDASLEDGWRSFFVLLAAEAEVVRGTGLWPLVKRVRVPSVAPIYNEGALHEEDCEEAEVHEDHHRLLSVRAEDGEGGTTWVSDVLSFM